MTDNSSKLFRKILKNSFLVTASGAAIMFGSTGALAAARTTTAVNINLATGSGLYPAGGPLDPFIAGSTLQFLGAHNIQFANRAILAVDMNGFSTNAVVNQNISVGSITGTPGNTLDVTVNNTKVLTLTGTAGGAVGAKDYTGLGAITLGGVTAGLTINVPAGLITLDGTIDGVVANNGVLIVTTPTNFTGAIGGGNYVASAVYNADSTIASLVADSMNIGAANIEVTGALDIKTTLKFTADGQLTVGAGIATANVTNSAPNQGTLIVNGGDIQNVGSADAGAAVAGPLNLLTFNNAAGSNAGTIFATTTKISNVGTDLKAGLITGDVQFTAAGKLTANNGITGNVDFNGQDGTVTLEDGQTIAGAVDSSVGVGNLGKLVFIGDGTVTEDIGATKVINYIDIQGDNNIAVILQGNVNTQILKFTQDAANEAATVKITGNFAGAVTFTGNANAFGDGGIIEFNDATANASHIFAGTLTVGAGNADNGQITVNTALLTATDSSIGLIGRVKINDQKAFAVDAKLGNVALSVITDFSFVGNNSQLVLTNSSTTDDRTITFNDDLDPGGNVGIVTLQSKGNKLLTLNSIDGTEKLGTGANFKALNVDGQVTISGVFPGAGGNRLDVSGADLLNLYNGATFTDQGATSGEIATINIGAARPTGAALPVGTAKYILDVSSFAAANAAAPINLLSDAANNNVLSFLSAASEFTIQNTAAADQLVIFQNHVKGFDTGGAAGGGIVNLINTAAATTLIVSGADAKKAQLGNTNNIAQLNITGKVQVLGNYAPGAGYNALDLSRSDLLSIYKDATFIDESATSGSIKKINIGGALPAGGGAGKAIYGLNVSSTAVAGAAAVAAGGVPIDINLLSAADPANVLTFLSADSIFAILNVAAADQKVIFQNHVVGINNAGNGGGTVSLISDNGGTLTVSGADTKKAQLGNTNNLAELNITGNVIVTGNYTAGVNYNALDVSRSDLLTVGNDSFFIDRSSTSASIKTINIDGDGEYRLDVSTKAALAAVAGVPAAINLLNNGGAANVLTFLNAASTFSIYNTVAADQQVIFQNHVVGAAGGGGRVFLTSNGGGTLTVSGADNKHAQLGNTNPLTSLNITGKVTVTGNRGAGVAFNALDISRSGSLNVFNGATFIDQSATSDLIAGEIFIGEAPGGGVAGFATHAIDVSFAPAGAINLLTVADQIVFRDPNSVYEIRNLVNAQDITVTLQNTLAGGYNDGVNPAVDDGGIVFLTSSNVKTLTVQSKTGGETFGAGGNALSALGITGKVTIVGTAGKAVDISNTQVLDVYNGATFTDKSATSATIAAINIGADPAGGAATGAAVHVIDVSTAAGAAVNLLGNNVIFKDAGSTLKIQNTVAFDKTVTLTNSIEGNVPNGAGGIVELNAATNKLTINGGKTLGTNANKLQTLKLSGNGEIVLTGTKYFATNLDLSVKAVTLDDVPQHLEFSGDTILTETGNIASVDFKGKNAIINMANGTNITGAVTNTVAPPTNNGTINFEGTGTIGGNITGLAMLKVGAGAVALTAGGPTVITEIQGTGTDTLTLGPDFKLTGSINSTGGKALKLNFTNGGSVSGVVGTAANSVGDITTAGVTSFASSVNAKGTATFGGTTSFADTFNNTGAVTLAAQSINTFNKQITATSMVANNATMIINAPMPISGTNLTGSGTTITLGSNQLLLSAGTKATFTDQLTLNTNFDGTANTGGNILITGAGSEMDLSGVTKLKVVISTTNFDPNNINPNTQYTLAAAASEGTLKQLASADAIETDIGAQENQFLKWTLNPTSLVLSPSIVDNVNDRIEEELTTGDLKDASLGVKADIRALETATDPNSEGFKFKVTMGNILDNEELTTKVMKAVGDSQDQVPSSDAVNNTTVAVTNTVVSAMGSLNSRMNSFQAVNQPIAVASGDEDEAKFGVWATPFVGNSTQKMRNNINGNKTNFGGATVGFDGMINDQVVLGVAYTRAGTKIKQKNDKIGDSSKVKSNIYSIYGLYNLPNNNLFFQAVGSYSDSRIKSYSQRYQPVARNTLATQIANGNYKSRGFTGQIMAGYDYVAPQAVKLTPMVGLRYSKVKDSGYTETGTTLQNLIVKGKNYNLVNGLAGVKLSKDINTGHMILTPEIYGMLDYGFKNKLPTPDARLQGMTTPFPASKFKPVKTTWNVGTGVTAKYKMMEYGVNYDANVASKYFAQQGSVKIRVNF
ncbi:autotransporter outer membrane beta-barrel domain-containing protein [Rickettsia endosymbiont of Orchestes rusci]|uniref:autotransporter outer membrane beta-barrel domain-containing protein n=1 Tax=Rickettsia endosymbiont of Orchestes rusci TaxID=3066250 RepID=UPI00313A9E42